MTYTLLNAVLVVAAGVAMALCLSSRRDAVRVLRVAGLLVCIGYPWDFMALQLGAWTHTDPGIRLFTVPLNDLLIVFLMSVVTSSVLLRLFPDFLGEPDDHAEGEGRDDETSQAKGAR